MNDEFKWQLNRTYQFRKDEIGYKRYINDRCMGDGFSQRLNLSLAELIAEGSFQVIECTEHYEVTAIKLTSGQIVEAQKGIFLLNNSDLIYFTKWTPPVIDTAKADMELLITAMELREQGLLIIPNPNDFSNMGQLIAEIRSAVKHVISNKKNTLRHIQEEIESLEKILK